MMYVHILICLVISALVAHGIAKWIEIPEDTPKKDLPPPQAGIMIGYSTEVFVIWFFCIGFFVTLHVIGSHHPSILVAMYSSN